MLYIRAQTTEKISNIDTAIGVLEKTVSLVLPGAFVTRRAVGALSKLFALRYSQLREIADLASTLVYSWEWVSIRKSTDLDRFEALTIFVDAYNCRGAGKRRTWKYENVSWNRAAVIDWIGYGNSTTNRPKSATG
jgi:hypothetical protein